MNRFTRKLLAGTCALGLLTTGAGIAGADDIVNSLVADAGVDSMAFTLGDGPRTTTLSVNPTNGDSKNGCNLTGSTTMTATVASSDTTVATVSPSTVTFDSCGTTEQLTVTALKQGSATVSLTQMSNNTGGTFNLAPAAFTVDVRPAPVVIQPDTTGPVIRESVIGNLGGNGWYTSDVTLSWSVTDAESDIASERGCEAVSITQDQQATTYTCEATNGAGITSRQSVTIKRDRSAPAVAPILIGQQGANGWHTSDVDLSWDVTDTVSGIVSSTGCGVQTIAADGVETFECSATNGAGLTTSESVTVKRDTAAPTNVEFVGAPVDGGRYFPTQVPTAPSCTADDVTSQVASCQVSGLGTTVGTHTVTATATDHAGNVTTATRTYTVRLLELSGFFSPVDMGSTVNTVKAGSTVPLKFNVLDEGVQQTSTALVAGFTTAKVACTSLGVLEDALELVTTGGTALRYDATGSQFIQNWQTPKTAGICYQAMANFVDGQSVTANFRLK